MNKILTLVIVICLVGLTLEGQTISIYHTNNNNGTLENCYCPDHPLGSIEKRLAYLKNVRKENPGIILLDAGDFLSVSDRQPFKDSLVCVAYGLTDYDGIGLGDQEIFRDENFLTTNIPSIHAPVIASNIKSQLPIKTVPYIILERQGIKIRILGIIGSDVFKYYPEEIKNSVEIIPPETAIKQIIDGMEEKVDFTILLSHQGYEKDLELAEKLENIDLIIGGHSQTVVTEPEKTNGIVVAQSGKEGYYLGKILVDFNGSGSHVIRGELVPMLLEMPNDPQIEKLVELFEKHSGHMNPRKRDLLRSE